MISYKMYYKIKRNCPTIFYYSHPYANTCYFTGRTADQQNRTCHVFADHNCLHAMIDLLNKSPLIKDQVTTNKSFLNLESCKCKKRQTVKYIQLYAYINDFFKIL